MPARPQRLDRPHRNRIAARKNAVKARGLAIEQRRHRLAPCRDREGAGDIGDDRGIGPGESVAKAVQAVLGLAMPGIPQEQQPPPPTLDQIFGREPAPCAIVAADDDASGRPVLGSPHHIGQPRRRDHRRGIVMHPLPQQDHPVGRGRRLDEQVDGGQNQFSAPPRSAAAGCRPAAAAVGLAHQPVVRRGHLDDDRNRPCPLLPQIARRHVEPVPHPLGGLADQGACALFHRRMVRQRQRNSDFRNAESTSDIGHGRPRAIAKLVLTHPRLRMEIDNE